MSEFCDSELIKWHRIYCKTLQIMYSNIALSLALMAATASANYLHEMNE